MGEAAESTPMVVVRGLGVPIGEGIGVPTIDASECLFMGVALHADPVHLRRLTHHTGP